MKLSVLFTLVAFTGVFAQDDVEIQYFDANWSPSKKNKATYYRKIEKKDSRYLVRNYWTSNDQLQMEGMCKSVNPDLVFDGIVTWYNEKGVPTKSALHRGAIVRTCQVWSVSGEPLLQAGTGIVQEELADSTMSFSQFIDSLTAVAYTVGKADTIYTVPGKPFSYKGGMKNFYKVIAENMMYPAAARKAHTTGKVYVEFVIDKQGKLVDPRVVKGIGNGCDEEVVRCIEFAQDWIPAVYQGKPVKARGTLPITFNLGK